MPTTVTIDSRFRGPPQSSNGGYCCGLLARHVGQTARVTLRAPPPLDKPLTLVTGSSAKLLDGETLVAEAEDTELDLEVPTAVPFDAAQACATHYIARDRHAFPMCFVCGPHREDGDGLRIFPGRREPNEPAAAPWVPHPSLADADGTIPTEVLWAALDCPGYFGAVDKPVVAVLGRMTGRVDARVQAGDKLVAMGWSLGREGRKLHAGSALFTEAGQRVGASRQTWILLDKPV